MTRIRWTGRRLVLASGVAIALLRARLDLFLMDDARVLARLLAVPKGVPLPSSPPLDWLTDLTWALNGLARRAPFRADCLVRTFAARRILERRNYSFEIGIQAGHRAETFEAHAWLESCGVQVTGGPIDELTTLVAADRTTTT